MTYWPAIRQKRESLGWSQQKLAEAVGTTQQTIDKIERGVIQRTTYLPEINKALGAVAPARADIEHLWARFVNHYWDSLEGDKAIVLKHIRAVLDYHEESHERPQQAGFPDDPVDIVREVLTRRKISANKLADKCGLAASTLNRALNNPKHKFMLSTRTLLKIKEWDNAHP